MKTFLKVLKILGITLLISLVVLIILIFFNLKENAKYIESFKAYSPCQFPNTKWVCQEEDLYFIPDDYGELRGQVGTPGAYIYYTIGFSYRGPHFGVDKLLEPDYGSAITAFGGEVSFSENTCVLTYQGENDEEHLWGDKTGEVTLTFVKEDQPEILVP